MKNENELEQGMQKLGGFGETGGMPFGTKAMAPSFGMSSYGTTVKEIVVLKTTELTAFLKESLTGRIADFEIDYKEVTQPQKLWEHFIEKGASPQKAEEVVMRMTAGAKVNYVPVIRIKKSILDQKNETSFSSKFKEKFDINLGFINEVNRTLPIFIEGSYEISESNNIAEFFLDIMNLAPLANGRDICNFGDKTQINKSGVSITFEPKNMAYTLEYSKNSLK